MRDRPITTFKISLEKNRENAITLFTTFIISLEKINGSAFAKRSPCEIAPVPYPFP
jgi:hypothetical protein